MTAAGLHQSSMVIVALSRLAILIPGMFWLASNNHLYFWVALISLFLTEVPRRLIRDPLLRDVAMAITATLLAAHIALGMYLALYELSSIYDKVMHVIGSGAIAMVLNLAATAYCRRQRLKLPRPLLVFTVFAVTLSAGTVWEIFEFAIDRTGLFVAQRSLRDTMFDLLADALGASLGLAVVAAAIRLRKGQIGLRGLS